MKIPSTVTILKQKLEQVKNSGDSTYWLSDSEAKTFKRFAAQFEGFMLTDFKGCPVIQFYQSEMEMIASELCK